MSPILPNNFQSPIGYKNVGDQDNNIIVMLLDSCPNRIAVLLEISSGYQMFQLPSLLLFLWRGMFGWNISWWFTWRWGGNRIIYHLSMSTDSLTKLEVHYCVIYFRMPNGNCSLKNRAGQLIRRVYINKNWRAFPCVFMDQKDFPYTHCKVRMQFSNSRNKIFKLRSKTFSHQVQIF